MRVSDIRYKKAIEHIKKTGLLTDPLNMTQVHNAIYIAAYGEKRDPGLNKRDRDKVLDRRI